MTVFISNNQVLHLASFTLGLMPSKLLIRQIIIAFLPNFKVLGNELQKISTDLLMLKKSVEWVF